MKNTSWTTTVVGKFLLAMFEHTLVIFGLEGYQSVTETLKMCHSHSEIEYYCFTF